MQRLKFQCVVVLYRCTLSESKTIQSLIACLLQNSSLSNQFAILIYDNSPLPQPFEAQDWPLVQNEYRHDASNGGLAAAYNCALSLARNRGIDWLLLLDQDTLVELSLLSTLVQQIAQPVQSDICAMVPKLINRQIVISPQIVAKYRNVSIAADFSGVAVQPLTALNSGACLRVSAVTNVGGFPKEYWLEYLDHIMFDRLQNDGGKVLILDVTLQHQLSIQNLETEMSLDRYTNVLKAEWSFIRETGWGSGSLMHRLRLVKRAGRHMLKLRNKRYALETLRAALS
ncbi:glycosyltransferase [soil metagenome]